MRQTEVVTAIGWTTTNEAPWPIASSPGEPWMAPLVRRWLQCWGGFISVDSEWLLVRFGDEGRVAEVRIVIPRGMLPAWSRAHASRRVRG